MNTVPGDTPPTIPEEVPIVATDVLLLDHTPPVAASLNVRVLPTHRVVTPVIDVGPPTVTTVVTIQLEPVENDIVDVPDDTPVTIPVEDPTVATVVLLLVHTPLPE